MNAITYISQNTDQNFFNGFAVGMMIQTFVDSNFKNTPFEHSDFHDWILAICAFIEGKDVDFVSHNHIRVGDESIFISESSWYFYCRYLVVSAREQAYAEYNNHVTPLECDDLPF